MYVGDIFSQMLMGNLILTSTVVMTRDRLEKVGRFDETLVTGEDHDFFMRVCREGPVVFADIADGRCRVGAIDRLSGRAMGLEIAKAYLRVTERTLALDADRITLSPKLIDTARATDERGWVSSTSSTGRRVSRAPTWRPRCASVCGNRASCCCSV